MGMVHVIGAGISGLAAATRLAEAHIPVRLYEATANAGGRAKSSQDAKLGTIDHGLHLIEPTSLALFSYLKRIRAEETLERVPQPLALPAAPMADYAELAALLYRRTGNFETLLSEDSILAAEWAARWSRLALHTPLPKLSTQAARRAFKKYFRQRPLAAEAYVARDSLQASFVTPALAHLEYCGASLYFNHALKSIERGENTLKSLGFARQKIPLSAEDVVILATPAPAAEKLIPGLAVTGEYHHAITLHFRANHREASYTQRAPVQAPVDLVRYLPGRISATLRVANHAWHSDPTLLAERVWRWLQKQHPYLAETPRPPHAIWREKNAGILLTQAHEVTIPPLPERLLLAGDWLTPHAPSTLEAAARSGHQAAEQALALIGPYTERRQ